MQKEFARKIVDQNARKNLKSNKIACKIVDQRNTRKTLVEKMARKNLKSNENCAGNCDFKKARENAILKKLRGKAEDTHRKFRKIKNLLCR